MKLAYSTRFDTTEDNSINADPTKYTEKNQLLQVFRNNEFLAYRELSRYTILYEGRKSGSNKKSLLSRSTSKEGV